jgi:uridine kinase
VDAKIVAVSGGSCSGKSTFANKAPFGVVVSTDDFYLTAEECLPEEDGTINWEHPSAVDLKACVEACLQLAAGGTVDIPIYSIMTDRRIGYRRVENTAKRLVILEGIFAFEPLFSPIVDKFVFLDVGREVRFNRRLARDLGRGVPLEVILRNLGNAETSEHTTLAILRQRANVILKDNDVASFWETYYGIDAGAPTLAPAI